MDLIRFSPVGISLTKRKRGSGPEQYGWKKSDLETRDGVQLSSKMLPVYWVPGRCLLWPATALGWREQLFRFADDITISGKLFNTFPESDVCAALRKGEARPPSPRPHPDQLMELKARGLQDLPPHNLSPPFFYCYHQKCHYNSRVCASPEKVTSARRSRSNSEHPAEVSSDTQYNFRSQVGDFIPPG